MYLVLGTIHINHDFTYYYGKTEVIIAHRSYYEHVYPVTCTHVMLAVYHAQVIEG